MKLNNQNQKAGDNSQQFQSDNIVVNIGIDEKRAREIYQEMNLQLRNDYSIEALTIANSRVNEFENRLLSKMQAVDGALEAFADPSFQLLLVEAQKTAASTERPADYDLLAELLVYRFQKGENRVTRAGISRAVEIVDDISDDSLLGLTIFHSVSYFTPTTGNISVGLHILNDLFGKLFYDELPIGNEWIDHLDILDAVRSNPFNRFKKFEQFYTERLSGYTEIGIEKESENHKIALELISTNGIPPNILVEHTLNNAFLRLDFPHRNEVNDFILEKIMMLNGSLHIIPVKFSEKQIAGINAIYDLYHQNQTIKQQNIKTFMVELEKYENLRTLRIWWDNIESAFKLTSVGKVLAHSNAQRCDKSLPPLS